MMRKKITLNNRSTTPVPTRRQSAPGREPSRANSSEADSDVFRRNRTMKRSNAAASKEQSSRETSHQLRKQRRSLSLYLVSLLAVVVVLGVLVYQLTAQVTLSLYGSLDALSEQHQIAYQATIDDYFASRPTERLRFLTRLDDLSSYLQQHGHAEVESIASINFAGLGRSALVLEVREPVARWIIDKKLQFVDERGSIFTKSYYKTPTIKIIDKSGITTTNAQTVTSSRFLGFVGKAIGALDSHSFAVKEVIIPPATTRQVQLKTTNNVRIKMAIDRTVGEQAEDAARALKYLAKKKRNATYIDVRVSNKAYYK